MGLKGISWLTLVNLCNSGTSVGRTLIAMWVVWWVSSGRNCVNTSALFNLRQ